jgi:hypothetical protein
MEGKAPVKSFSNLNSLLLSIFFIGGLILTVFEIDIYRVTIISYAIPTCIWIITGLFATPFFRNIPTLQYNMQSFFLQIVYNIAAWGGIAVYVFMASNYCFAHGSITTTFRVDNTGHLAKGRYGCGEPYVEINYYGVTKQLVFPCDMPVATYKTVELKTETGLWGYEIIKSKKLLGNN